MSTQNMYTVYDAAAQAYGPPFFSRTHGEAIRSFESACADPQRDFFKHATDYSMWHIGQFDDQTGAIIPAPLNCLSKAHEVVARQPQAA